MKIVHEKGTMNVFSSKSLSNHQCHGEVEGKDLIANEFIIPSFRSSKYILLYLNKECMTILANN